MLGTEKEIEIYGNKFVVGNETKKFHSLFVDLGYGKAHSKISQIYKSEDEGSQQCNPQTEPEG